MKMTNVQLLSSRWKNKSKQVIEKGELISVIPIKFIPHIINEAMELKTQELKTKEKCNLCNAKAEVLTVEGYPMCDRHYRGFRFKWLNKCPRCSGEVEYELKEVKHCIKCKWRS